MEVEGGSRLRTASFAVVCPLLHVARLAAGGTATTNAAETRATREVVKSMSSLETRLVSVTCVVCLERGFMRQEARARSCSSLSLPRSFPASFYTAPSVGTFFTSTPPG